MPGQWSVGDDNSNNGYDYWGDFDFTSYTGGWSVWCADVGDMNPGEKYDDNMSAYMIMTQSVDLTNYQNTYLSYQLLYDTEENYDKLIQIESYDGTTWDTVQYFTGFDGWVEINKQINSGGMYYIKFQFVSDGTISEYEGAYIDDIKITGDPTPQPQPNLTYNWNFSNDGPIVISQVPNTNLSDNYSLWWSTDIY